MSSKHFFLFLLFFLYIFGSDSFADLQFKQSKDISDDTDDLRGIFIKPDGTRVYVTSDDATPTVIEYSLNVPFDISTASKTSQTNLLVSGGAAMDKPHAIEFKPDGKVMYVIHSNSGSVGVEQFNLTTAWDTQTLSYDTSLSISDDVQIRALAFKSDGTRVYIAQRDHGKVKQFDLPTPWDLSSATNKVESNSFSGEENNLRNIQFSSDGTFMYLGGNGGDDINRYKLPIAWDISTITHETTFSISAQTGEMRGFKFTANFTKLYVTGDDGSSSDDNVIYEYDLDCAGTITCLDASANSDVKAIIEANVDTAKRIIKNNTLPIFHRTEWLRRHKNKDNLSNLNAEIDFSNQKIENITNALNIFKKEKDRTYNSDDWFEWSEGRISFGKKDTNGASSRNIHSYGFSIGADKIKKRDRDSMYGYVFQYTNDNVDIGSEGTNLNTDSYGLALYETKLRDDQFFTDSVIGFNLLHIDHQRVTYGNTLKGDREGQQIYGSINFGKRLVEEEINYNPGIKLDLGYTKLKAFREKTTLGNALTDSLIYKEQNIKTALATIGLLFDTTNQQEEKTTNHHGRLEYVADFSPSSNAEFYYVNNQSTNYEYKSNNKSSHNYRIGYGFDITSISGWSIVTNFERFGASGEGYVNELYLLLGYVPIDDTEYAFKLDDDKASLIYKKNLNGFDIKMSSNYNFIGEIPDYGANLEISNKF
jgi:DNA-binding beta-propeller fold protein YncE